ncbi:MAG: hypothetical protein AAGF24_13165 [Cyanobacteria bacterium P01_H01_bin.121]
MTWESFNLDRVAQDLIFRHRDSSEALQQVQKIQTTAALGFVRFWGECRRTRTNRTPEEDQIWQDTWVALQTTLAEAGIELPNQDAETQALWTVPYEQQEIALAVLAQLSEYMVWWTQRYKKFADVRRIANG